jgi:Delta3-Delta2-enoyl-CoA isomerase
MEFISYMLRASPVKTRPNAKLAVITMLGHGVDSRWGTSEDEHRFHPGFVSELDMAVSMAEENKDVLGLLVTGHGKYFSNGFDVGYISANPHKARALQTSVENLMARILSSRLVTVAALNGHTTAAGAIFALCFDYRLMSTRGLFFTPAVRLGIVYSAGLVEVVKAKVSNTVVLRDMLLMSKRYDSQALLNLGVVESIHSPDQLLDSSTEFLTQYLEPNTEALAEVKRRLYHAPLSVLGNVTLSSDMWWDRVARL